MKKIIKLYFPLQNPNIRANVYFYVMFYLFIHFQVLEIIRYIYGPFPNFLCNLVYLIRNICPLQLILFLNASFVIRYVYVFHSTNPTAYQDDFFIFFLSIWTYSKSFSIGHCQYEFFSIPTQKKLRLVKK